MRGVQERGTLAPLTAARRRRLAVTGVVAAVVVAADQATTTWALADLHRAVHRVGPLGLALQYNSGTAFSMLSGAGAWLSVVVIAVVAGIGWLAWRAGTTLMAVAFGMVLGGALGNLVDRLVRAHHGDVVDFITLSHWPTFNVADACITVGMVLLAAGYLWQPSPQPGTTPGGSPGASQGAPPVTS